MQSHAPRIAYVTGATGFIGRAMCLRLIADGWHCRGAIRTRASQARLPKGVEPVVIGDLGMDQFPEQSLKGVRAVVHLAAAVHFTNRRNKPEAAYFHRVNVDGTVHLASAAVRMNVQRFIQISSVKVNGEGRELAYREKDPPSPSDTYGLSKWLAEKRLWEIVSNSRMGTTVIRPPLVYGPGVGGNFLSLIKLVDSGIPLPLASISNRRSIIYRENLIDAIKTVINSSGANGKTYFVADAESLSTPELIQKLAQHLQRSPRLIPFPPKLLLLLGIMTGQASRCSRLFDSLTVETDLIQTDLNWSAPVSGNYGLEQTANWFRYSATRTF